MSATHRRDLADDVRARIDDPHALVEALGLKITARQRRGVTVLCPVHGERSGSCSVTLGPDGTVRFKCFGCDESGDAFALIAAVHQLSVRRDFVRVLEIAAGIVGVSTDVSTPPPPRILRPVDPPPLDVETFHRIVSHFDPIDQHADVLAYAAKRLPGVDVSELRALPSRRRDLEAMRDRIVSDVGAEAWQRSGLATRDSSLVWFEHRLCIPWRDDTGRVVTVQRRTMGTGEPKYVFPSGRAPRLPYGVERVASIGPAAAVAYVEGALDVLALRAISAREGYDWCVLGVPGVGNWRGSWANVASGRVSIVALDGDEAGEAAAEAVARDLRMAGAISIRRARPEGAKDWSALLEVGL